MRFRFDANQEYQVRAIEAVADVFQGQARVSGAVRFQLGASPAWPPCPIDSTSMKPHCWPTFDRCRPATASRATRN